jgi:gamma-tubulin complex component 2
MHNFLTLLLLSARYYVNWTKTLMFVLKYADCGKNNPELAKEMEKQFVDLLNEELKLQQVVAEEHSHHMNATLVEAKRQATQYQREAEKCNAATETCEETREQSEAAISKEKKLTAMWEQRARQLGWQDSRATSM